MDTIVYLRRSVVDEARAGEVSHEQQLARCRELAMQHSTAEPVVLTDWGKSGGEGLEGKRGAYQELRDRIAAGRVKWVISYDLSRLSRSTRETLDLVDHARRHGARIHVGDLGILDPSDPAGKFTISTLAASNALIRDMASKRSREAAAARKAKGLAVGHLKYGDRPGEDPGRVLEAFDRGGSFHAAARVLNEEGVRSQTGAGWRARTVQHVVERYRPRSVTSLPRVRSRGHYMLTGLLRCHCGRRMALVRAHGRPTAVCMIGRTEPGHPKPLSITEAKLLPWIKVEAARLRTPTAVVDTIVADDARRAQLEAKRTRIIDMAADGVIDKADRDRRLADVVSVLDELAVREQVIQVPTIDWSWSPDAINGVLRALWEYVELDKRLQPLRASWRVTEWRAP